MSVLLKRKYESIDQSKISDAAKTALSKIKEATNNFSSPSATKQLSGKFLELYDKIKSNKPEAIKGFQAPKSTQTRVKAASVAKTASSAVGIAKKLLEKAKERRKAQGLGTSDENIIRDAGRPALPTGKRIAKKSKNTYYEYRENRIDRKPKNYPKLAEGGMMKDGGRVLDDVEMYVMIHGYYPESVMASTGDGMALGTVRADERKFELSKEDGKIADEMGYEFDYSEEGWVLKDEDEYAEGGGVGKLNESLKELEDFKKRQLSYIEERIDELGFTKNNPNYNKYVDSLEKTYQAAKKIIDSGLINNPDEQIRYSYKITKDGYAEGSVLLDSSLVWKDDKNWDEWQEKRKQYGSAASKGSFIAGKIGLITEPILGRKLSSEVGYSNIGDYYGGSFKDGGSVDEYAKGGLMRNGMEIHRANMNGYAKGGNISNRSNYLSQREIHHIETKKGKVIKGSQVIDGAYVKKGVKFAKGGMAMPEVSGFKLVYENWDLPMDGIAGTIRTYPQNYWVASVNTDGEVVFNSWESMVKAIDMGKVKLLWDSGQIRSKNEPKVSRYMFEEEEFEYAKGGGVDRIMTMPKSMVEEIKDSVRMGYNQVQVGMISPKRKGVMLMNTNYEVRGTYPLEYKEFIEDIVSGHYANGGSLFGGSHYNTGRSWHLDRARHNQNEEWEKPMNQRKKSS